MERMDRTADKVKIVGRKIFFVNPSSKISNHVLLDLRDNEYEAYCIDDFRHVKYALQNSARSPRILNAITTLHGRKKNLRPCRKRR